MMSSINKNSQSSETCIRAVSWVIKELLSPVVREQIDLVL